ncbi:hypothetical protein [Endozoicomonas sp. Mp262]|uniref:hypothetical protein n=1 Tax=Endozoicomonas sp. Mp262 TaxID=2919499 RepID=UPI0021DAE7D0
MANTSFLELCRTQHAQIKKHIPCQNKNTRYYQYVIALPGNTCLLKRVVGMAMCHPG